MCTHTICQCDAMRLYYCIMLRYTTIHYIILARVCKIIECSFPLSVAVLMPYALCCNCFSLVQCKWCQCKGPWYCSKDCQKEAYKEHTPQCAVVVAKQELELGLCEDIAHEIMRYAFKHWDVITHRGTTWQLADNGHVEDPCQGHIDFAFIIWVPMREYVWAL